MNPDYNYGDQLAHFAPLHHPLRPSSTLSSPPTQAGLHIRQMKT